MDGSHLFQSEKYQRDSILNKVKDINYMYQPFYM